MPRRRWMRRISARIAPRSLASRLDSGSSKQQHLGLHDQGAGQGDPLLLAAGQLVRGAVLQADEVHARQRDLHGAVHVVVRAPAQFQPVGDVLRDAQVREQRVALEDHRHRAALRRHVVDGCAVEQDVTGAWRSRSRRSMRRVVVLPQPDGPSRVMNSPGSTSSVTSSTAVTPAAFEGKVLVSRSSRSLPASARPFAGASWSSGWCVSVIGASFRRVRRCGTGSRCHRRAAG